MENSKTKTKLFSFMIAFSLLIFFVFPAVNAQETAPLAGDGTSGEVTEAAPAGEASQTASTEETSPTAPSDKTSQPVTPDETSQTETLSGMSGEGEGAIPGVSLSVPQNFIFTGSASYEIPIEVPPGRGGIAPQIALRYNSYQKDGWVGVGWNLDLGAIQRSTKWGVDYTANDFIALINGSSSELVPRDDWGPDYYGAKIEGAFSKFYRNSSTGGWEMTTKTGTKYYYGTTSLSRQDNIYGIFKWSLDKVQDTNGNYMTVTYWKDQGEIYLDRIDYTGNGSLSPTNYVEFNLENRSDIPFMYPGNALVKTAYRLKNTEIYGNGQLVRKYELNYSSNSTSKRSLLNSLTQYGSDGITPLPQITFEWSDASGFDNKGAWISGAYADWWNYPSLIHVADVNGDGKADIVLGPDGVYGNWYVMLSTGRGAFPICTNRI